MPLLLLVLLLKAIAIVFFILHGSIGLGPDEAQYWTWSQLLDWGYYSKPPGIAWQIALGTSLFGNTELGVRFGAIIIGTLLPLAVYYLGKSAGLNNVQACWAGLCMALSPLGFLSSFLAITDGGIVLFWVIATAVMIRSEKETPDIVLGLLVGLGALFKWWMYYFWIVRLAWALYKKEPLTKNLWIGLALSLLGLVPSLIWNMQHDWATFKHVFYTFNVPAEQEKGAGSNFFEFLGAQIGLLSPLLFGLFILSIPSLFKTKDKPRFLGSVTAGVSGLYTLTAIFKKLQGNWCSFVYPAGFVWIVKYTFDRFKNAQTILTAALALSCVLVGFGLLYPLSYRITPFKHNLGWSQLKEALTKSGYDSHKDFLFGDKYQSTSLLSFYGPDQKRAYFLNVHGTRHNQFSYWPGLAEEQLGKTGYFVTWDKDSPEVYMDRLKPYFEKVELAGRYPLLLEKGTPVKEALVIKATRYNGKVPPENSLY